MKIISLPKYDEVTNSFKDNKLPASADAFFTSSERMKDFFEIKTVKPEPKHI